MKYLPLVWAALRRHTAESLLTFLVLTIAFTQFSSMVALKAAYDQAINVNRMDRLLVTDRFRCTGLNIARRDDDDFRIESGRMLRTGSQELLIGVGASRRFGLKSGDKLPMPGGF